MNQFQENNVRRRLSAIVNKAEKNDAVGRVYNAFICVVAVASLIPLMFRQQTQALDLLDTVTIYLLFLDYNLRWLTYDYTSKYKDWRAFVLYPFTPFALFDLLSLLPSFGLVGPSFRLLRMLRFVKVLRYSKSFTYIANVIKNEARTLLSVLVIAAAYIFLSALAMFCNETDSEIFQSFFDALYWATTALTTVGYGDIIPKSDIGRLISMISSLFGIAVIALPAGVVTGGYIEQMNKEKEKKPLGPIALPPLQRLNRQTLLRFWAVLIIGVFLNEACYTLVKDLPLWLDMVGTCYAAIVMGPMAGLLVGLVDNAYLALDALNNSTIVYYAVSACAALMIGCLLGDSRNRTWKRVLWVSLATAGATALLSFFIRMWLYGGAPDAAWEMGLYQSALSAGYPVWAGCLYSITVVRAMDWAASLVILYIAVNLTSLWDKRHAHPGCISE